MSVLEHIKQLSANLTLQDKQALSEFLSLNDRSQTMAAQPESLRGIWQAAFPDSFDLDAALHEIRSEWEKDLGQWSDSIRGYCARSVNR